MRSVVRAAFDIGSGATKLAVARVTVERRAPFAHVDEILFSEQRAVHLRASMLKSGADTCLGEDIVRECASVLCEFKCTAEELGATEFHAIATSVFRTAKNADEVMRVIEEALGFTPLIIPHHEEAILGFRSAVAAAHAAGIKIDADAPLSPRLLSWDSGGGSFQISDGKHFFGAEIGSAKATAMLLEIQGRKDSPNPTTMEHLDALRQELAASLPAIPKWLCCHNAPKRVIAIGESTCAFRMCSLATGENAFTSGQLRDSLKSIVGMDDSTFVRLGYSQPNTVCPKICLVLAVMEHLFPTTLPVRYLSTNGATLGMLTASTWPTT